MRQGCSICVLALYRDSNVLGGLLELGGKLCFTNVVGVFFETSYLCLVLCSCCCGYSVAFIVATAIAEILSPFNLGLCLGC